LANSLLAAARSGENGKQKPKVQEKNLRNAKNIKGIAEKNWGKKEGGQS